jgi:hypothetical protein
MGQEAINQIQADWISMATHWVGSEWQQSEGIIINLLQSEYSKHEIWAIILVNNARINDCVTS